MQKLLIAMTVGILLTMTSSGSAQQLTKEMVDNMLKMCGTGQKDKEKYTGDLQGGIDLLKRLGIIQGSGQGAGSKTVSEISTIIDSISDPTMKIASR
jgi:hypothetical protein